MPSQEHNSSLLDLVPDTIIELFEIDLGEQDGIYRFHPGIISTDQLIFGSKSYFALPVDASGFEKRADGQMARPTLTFANPEGLISDILKGRKDLVGKHFKIVCGHNEWELNSETTYIVPAFTNNCNYVDY